MKFKNIDDAQTKYLEGHQLIQKATNQGDYKTNNRIIKNQINPAFEYLKRQGKLDVLLEFLNQDDNIDLKHSTAVAFLFSNTSFVQKAIEALKEIANRSNVSEFNSFKAKMVLENWEKGLL